MLLFRECDRLQPTHPHVCMPYIVSKKGERVQMATIYRPALRRLSILKVGRPATAVAGRQYSNPSISAIVIKLPVAPRRGCRCSECCTGYLNKRVGGKNKRVVEGRERKGRGKGERKEKEREEKGKEKRERKKREEKEKGEDLLLSF